MTATPAQMVDAIKKALESQQPGLVAVTTPDGTTVRYDRRQLLDELRYWQREAARTDGTRPRAATIDLS